MRAPSPAEVLFAARALPARLRYRLGRESLVPCAPAGAERGLAQVLDERGRPLGTRRLSRERLAAGTPRGGREGFARYADALRAPGPARLTRLACASCGHRWTILLEGRGDPGAPTAEFRADWFRFAPSGFAADPELDCPRCETLSRPDVVHLREP